MKQLTQDIFKDAPPWVKSAVVDSEGGLWCSMYPVSALRPDNTGWFVITGDKDGFRMVGKGYYEQIANWQNSAIDREVV